MTTNIPQLTLPQQVFASAPASILLPVTLGAAVGYSTRPKRTTETYNLIRQPALRPPPSVFGPVWTLLYGVTGYAAHRAIGGALAQSQSGAVARRAAALYTAQLGLNLAWMPLFFGARRPGLALADVAALLGLNGYLAWLFFAAPGGAGAGGLGDRVAGWCYVPYVAWLGFAAYLNLGVGYLNDWDISDEALLRRREARGKKSA